ncbi:MULTISPECIES: helix-turn-helix domain-containing protein [unclassified Streptomyces]|uniref:TetR/AcrR family transcriptional regulator n=1 Tax=unclassified Streptomyces TaxID=2593676 RepID=UPI002DDBDA82|nr:MULTISPECIES: helix-turn-helix domain-containing protein [unclassified Streptomyces]WSA91372.1 TetR/AcrR family transcriptional regulator [Streptomyces sp. NBC_01795]WSB75696.1 TetR/AcrR family transcriptional regulator [Streptomyces sp. NBC_01775]WSS44838.1 TetR/AcrR family transcriptional regulator [Streptomyces sp. NBC_01187]
MATSTPDRRERKKAATRMALADAALRLFLERGYDNVTVREIADAADVATTTLLKYFPSKASLVFDKDSGLEAALIASVTDRPAGVSVPAALRAHTRTRVDALAAQGRDDFMELVRTTPALSEYAHKMWRRHQGALARAVASELDAPDDDPRCAALALFALETWELAARSDDPTRAVEAAFDLLEHGWHAER